MSHRFWWDRILIRNRPQRLNRRLSIQSVVGPGKGAKKEDYLKERQSAFGHTLVS